MKNDEKNIQDEIKNCNSDTEFLSLGVTMTVGEYAIVDKLANFFALSSSNEYAHSLRQYISTFETS